MRQIRQRFALVLEERARLAREIHDTLAQGFVGISSQLDAVALTLHGHLDAARQHLDLARKMARHSLTEARRSVMDLRASALEGQDLPAALSQAARQWTAGSAVQVHVDVAGGTPDLPEEMEQHLLRIAQEAVTNTVKHARASEVRIHLAMENGGLRLSVSDDGQGFEQTDAFSEVGGHFGLLGMRERAERLGGVHPARIGLGRPVGGGGQFEAGQPLLDPASEVASGQVVERSLEREVLAASGFGVEAVLWPTTPIARRTRSGRASTSCPATRALPSSGRVSVVRILTAVDLPAPFGPSRAKVVPPRR